MTRYIVTYHPSSGEAELHRYILSVEPISHPAGSFAVYIMDVSGNAPSEKVTSWRALDALDQALESLDKKHADLKRNGPRLRG